MSQNITEFGNPAIIHVGQERAMQHVSGWRASVVAGMSLIACAGIASTTEEGWTVGDNSDRVAASAGYSPDSLLDELQSSTVTARDSLDRAEALRRISLGANVDVVDILAPTTVLSNVSASNRATAISEVISSATPSTETYDPNYPTSTENSVATTRIIVLDDTKQNLPKLLRTFRKDVAASTDGSSRVVTKVKQISKSAKRAFNKLFNKRGCLDDASSPDSFGATIVADRMPWVVRRPSDNPNYKDTEIVMLVTDKQSCNGNYGVTSVNHFNGSTVGVIDVTLGNIVKSEENAKMKGKKLANIIGKGFGFVAKHELFHRWGLGHAGLAYSKDKDGNAYNLSSYTIQNMPNTIDLAKNIGEYDSYARNGDIMGYASSPYASSEINPIQGEMLARYGFTKASKYQKLTIGVDSFSIPASDPKNGIAFGSIDLGYTMPLQSSYTNKETISANSLVFQPVSLRRPDGSWAIAGFEVYVVDQTDNMVASVGKIMAEDRTYGVRRGTLYETTFELGDKKVLVRTSENGMSLQDVSPPSSREAPYVSEGK